MEKMKLESANIAQDNIEKIAQLFPSCLTETKDENGELKKAINFKMLQQILSEDIVDDSDEAYEFTWVGKKEAMVEAHRPINKTLRPCKEESKDWDNTENLYIEGDNLEVLKLLQESYLNSVKMIYIDPPYNTGNDFIYNDDFKMNSDEYKEEIGEVDEEGNRLFKNTDTNGRFHSDWCSMMYSRLMLARNLLSDDGAIFISIDDYEFENLKKLCDEIFGEENQVATFLWTKTSTPPSLATKCRKTVEYVMVYEKNKNNIKYFGDFLEGGDAPLLNSGNPIKKINFKAHSIYFPKIDNGFVKKGKKDKVEVLNDFYIEDNWNKEEVILKGEFKWEQNTVVNEINKGTYFLIKSDKFSIRFQRANLGKEYKTPNNLLEIELNKKLGVGTNESAVKELKTIGLDKYFDYPKPMTLIEQIIKMNCMIDRKALVLDFFSGTATTAHAVMDLNAEDGGNRKFIMVQLPEETSEKSAAYKAGYKNICEIGKERIRRAGDKIREDNADKAGIEDLDTGFRVLKVDDSNMKDVYFAPDEYQQDLLSELDSNIKENRTDLDLLFGCLLDWGVPINKSYESIMIENNKVHIYNDGDLIACFDNNISEETIKQIAKKQPMRVVFRDSSFENSPEKINVAEIFKLLSPDTSIKVI